MDLARLLGDEYLTKLQNDNNPELCEHIVRYIETEIIARKKLLELEFVMEVLLRATALHTKLDNVVYVSRHRCNNSLLFTGRVTVVGDLHGQYRDLHHLLSSDGPIGFPSPTNQVIFNGDMVDRGDMSVEIVVQLALISILSPGSVHMLQGNHEAEPVLNLILGFTDELTRKYANNLDVRDAFWKLFKSLPVAAVIDEAVFVVHGGLGRKTTTIRSINSRRNNRFAKQLEEGSELYELLWNDPVKHSGDVTFQANPKQRGEAFGATATATFLKENNLKLLVRSHEYCEQGFVQLHNGLCYTVFSAAHYCGLVPNEGAILQFSHPDTWKPVVVRFTGRHYRRVCNGNTAAKKTAAKCRATKKLPGVAKANKQQVAKVCKKPAQQKLPKKIVRKE